jgi:hypothetical protein
MHSIGNLEVGVLDNMNMEKNHSASLLGEMSFQFFQQEYVS